jgi:xanthine dehydrogenase/oxidase
MGIDFYSSGALVNVYDDGTVLVSIGGAECGQGINTKVILCVAQTLGVPVDSVAVGPRETSKIPNNTATGGSGTSECSSQAAIQACQELVTRLKPFQAGGKSFVDAVQAANVAGVSMMASSWFKSAKTASANTYATYGTACSEVLVDVLTGEVRVERVDILMDLGTQLDAAVDIGQVQGGFVISLGYLLTEELKVNSAGTQLNLGTWEYKIPSAYDIPVEFNVALLKDTPNPNGILGSKASAEPGMTLVSSVYLAVKDAVYAARAEMGTTDWFMLNTPLTPETIKEAIGRQTMEVPTV